MSRSKKTSRGARRGPTPRNRGVTTTRSKVEPSADGNPPRASGRYTRKHRPVLRPGWHKVVGAALLLSGVAIFALNDLAWFGVEALPGAHNELYALLAFLVALTGSWWFGWFDRPQSRW